MLGLRSYHEVGFNLPENKKNIQPPEGCKVLVKFAQPLEMTKVQHVPPTDFTGIVWPDDLHYVFEMTDQSDI